MSNSEITKLQNIQSKYEKDLLAALLYINNVDGENYIPNTLQGSDSRDTDENSSHGEIKEISQIMKNIKRKLLGTNLNKNINPGEVKGFMIEVQEKIMMIRKKEKNLLKQLKSEEFLYSTSREVLDDDMIAQWNTPVNLEVFLGTKTIKCNHSCKEVNDFFEFLTKSGGYTNGWNQDDHSIFLKTKSVVKSQQMLVTSLHRKLTNKTVYEIERHIDWYDKFLQLENDKLNAVRKWKAERKLNSVSSPISENILHTESHGAKILDKISRKKIKEKLVEWKKEKEDKKLQLIFVHENQRQRNLERNRQTENERNIVRKELDNWKFAKTYNDQLEREQKELLTKLDKKYREREANKRIKSFQAKDDYHLQRRLITRLRSKSVEIQKPKKEAPRDPKRLLKPTKQWLNRQSTANLNKNTNSISYINHVSRLAVPEWRKSLS